MVHIAQGAGENMLHCFSPSFVTNKRIFKPNSALESRDRARFNAPLDFEIGSLVVKFCLFKNGGIFLFFHGNFENHKMFHW